MLQLICHLVGDYILQTNWMANNKRLRADAAALHAFTYSLPFLVLQPSVAAFVVIVLSHYVIDHWGLARYVVFAKNWLNEPKLKWENCKATGYDSTRTPAWLATWLLIIADNTMHLAINYAALRWL